MNRVRRKYWYLITQTIYKWKFRSVGRKSVINKPLQLDEIKSISIDDEVYIADFAWLMGNNYKEVTINIKKGTVIGHYCHLVGKHSLTIEKNVLIADKVFISDCTHKYESVDEPIIMQDIRELSPVVIGEGSWIGENVSICGASVGKHCIVGANSVVTNDIPDFCVVVGSPAKVIKKYDFSINKWVNL